MMRKNPFTLLLFPVLVLAISLSCRFSGAPTPPRPVIISPEGAQSLNETVQTSQPVVKDGKVTLTVTESQVTSYVVENLQSDYAQILSNPVIVFQPDRAELYGTFHLDAITANGRVVLTMSVDSQGIPAVKIIEANFGPFLLPGGLLDNISTVIDRSIEDSMSEYQNDYRLESITFTTGKAVLVITRK